MCEASKPGLIKCLVAENARVFDRMGFTGVVATMPTVAL